MMFIFDSITKFFSQFTEWFTNLSIANKLGVAAFGFSILLFIIYLIRLIHWIIRKIVKPALLLEITIDDVNYKMIEKKGFLTFDLYIRNTGRQPIVIKRSGIVLSDGSEKTIYQQPHLIKTPSQSLLQSGEDAFYDNCDLYYALNDKNSQLKKITGVFVDVTGYKRYIKQMEVNPLLNDLMIRSILTDKKGLNGF